MFDCYYSMVKTTKLTITVGLFGSHNLSLNLVILILSLISLNQRYVMLKEDKCIFIFMFQCSKKLFKRHDLYMCLV